MFNFKNPQQWLRPGLMQLIADRYEILDHADIFGFPEKLNAWCQKWQHHVFRPNQRVLVMHIDLDYYPDSRHAYKVGNSNYNFFRCCQHYGIPTEYLIYVTSYYGMHQEVFDLCDSFNLAQPTVIETLNTPWIMPDQDLRDIEFRPDLVTHTFINMNGLQRTHRILTLCHLAERNLMPLGDISWNFDYAAPNLEHGMRQRDQQQYPESPVPLRVTAPFNLVNEDFRMSPQDIAIWNRHAHEFIGKRQSLMSEPETVKHEKQSIWHVQNDFVQQSFVNLVSESTVNFPYPCVTEKTFRPILTKRPFIIIGDRGCLDVVKKLGFKTFDSLWDESYNNIHHPGERIRAAIDTLQSICSLDAQQQKHMIDLCRPIVEYNFRHYMDYHRNNISADWHNA